METANLMPEVANKITEAHNILVALSSDPSVDEMAAAIGLTLYLDKIGKRATAIYSGETPNALQFLKPEETFEGTADVLQDFVIAINKDKADHLRYKLDGDFVKIYITPYMSRISEEDLDFSYGDFNIDLVIALDVANGVDLDAALREHGRIMHDAVIVNITTGKPGKLGEIEWSDKKASSVSEMAAKLLYNMGDKVAIGKDEATAFLTGIVAATNRFSNARTTAETMTMASKLMKSGANQQLISRNITPDMENELFSLGAEDSVEESTTEDEAASLDIEHDEEVASGPETVEPTEEVTETPAETEVIRDEPAAESVAEEAASEPEANEPAERTLMDDLKAAEASLASAGAEVVPEIVKEPVEVSEAGLAAPEKVVQPSADFTATMADNGNKYGQMLEQALEEPDIPEVPAMDYMPMPGDETLPPPPTPPVDFATMVETPAAMPSAMPNPAQQVPVAPVVPEPTMAQPAMTDQVYNPQANDPAAFKIPGA